MESIGPPMKKVPPVDLRLGIPYSNASAVGGHSFDCNITWASIVKI
jgi:hypothetical protein